MNGRPFSCETLAKPYIEDDAAKNLFNIYFIIGIKDGIITNNTNLL